MAKLSPYRQSFYAGAAIISAGGLISKILGALYRIPLTGILGSEGMGIYQMVYPLYCILLTISASGIPAGLARLISSGGGRDIGRSAFFLYGAIGAAGALLMYALAGPLAAAQGEPAVELCCKMLAPAVFFVAELSVVRGCFQGRGNMLPTALTEVIEQLIKVAFGCALAYTFRGNLSRAVAYTLLAVTISEALSCALALIMYGGSPRTRRPLYVSHKSYYGDILRYTVPITLTAIAMPLSQLAESIVAVNLLRATFQDATALYGIFSGCAVTIINLPVSVTYGLAAASVPKITPIAASGDIVGAKRAALKVLFATLALSVPAAIALYIFAPFGVKLVFGSLSAEHASLLVRLVRLMAADAAALSLVQSSSACLTALGKPSLATITQWSTCILRVVLCAALIKYTSLGVSGAAVAANCAYFVAVALNVWYIFRAGGRNEDNSYRSWRARRRYNAQG